MTKIDEQINSIEEYVAASADYHDALTLLAEAKVRVLRAIDANKAAGIAKTDPLRLMTKIMLDDMENRSNGRRDHVAVVQSKIVTTNSQNEKRTKNSPRNSPGATKKAVYDALPGDVRAIMQRTGLADTQVYAAAADLVAGGLVERHGTRGNTTYVVKGEKKNWDAKRFAGIYMNK